MSHCTRPLDADLVISAYARAWNQGDDAPARWRWLGQCWADDAVYEDGVLRLQGRRELDLHIAEFRQAHPLAHFAMTGLVTRDQTTLSFGWTLLDGGGRPTLSGHTMAMVGGSSRLCRVLSTLQWAAPRLAPGPRRRCRFRP